MRPDLHNEVTKRLEADFGLKQKGTYLRGGKCPTEHGGCGKRELWTGADKPWVLRCGREDKCGATFPVKQLYPDIFDDWSKRHKKTPENPNAAADAYLMHGRGFDLLGLRGSYSEEWYQDRELGIGSATVRFPLPGGTYWERLIDQPGRFGKKKANFGYGGSYKGQWWSLPSVSMAALAGAPEIWLCEGIFDAIALTQTAKVAAVSLMSCNNYPEAALAALRHAASAIGRAPPKLIFAFDVGKAGTDYTRRFVKRAREAGWICGAAQVRPDGEGDKLDWNDLAQRDKLTAADLNDYRWNGEVTIAPSASAKALLFYERDKNGSFPIVFSGRQLWANFSIERIQAVHQAWMESDDSELDDYKSLPFIEQWNKAAAEAVEISELANCVFRTLYFQRDPNLEEGAYFLRVDFPYERVSVKATFSGSACSTNGEFKKRLASIAAGAQWTGNQFQIDKLMQRQWDKLRTVEAIQHTGYSIDHSAWIFGDLAVHQGRVYEPNEEDFFVLGKRSVKLRTTDRMLRIAYDADKFDQSWVPHLVTAFGAKGIVVLAFWFASLFADHIRAEQDSLAFLEATGIPGTGKSTLIEFLWKLVGRANYEGFDPTKATNAGIARTLGQVGNLPVVFIEGDRGQETLHSRRFEWDELKTAYNGRAVRTRAIANGGMETFEPPFRGAIVIAQNDTVEASPAMRERIMGIHFDKARFSPATKLAAETLSAIPVEQISGFPVHVVRREAAILEAYRAAFKRHETGMLKHPGIRNGRLAKNHAQLAAMLDAMRLVVTNLSQHDVTDAHAFILSMLEDRQRTVESDHPHVEWFWERFDHMQTVESDTPTNPIDHSRVTEVHAINLVQFEQRCGDMRLQMPCAANELKRLLKTSKRRKFVEVKPINSTLGKTVLCWVFRTANATAR
ncbi:MULTISPECIES: toprim domain-containing protein [unclassified Sphingomonas]|uniref:toprim domain-containing protein n=1 Tax=unclassified Sphingomonas TaxID=196159 RepID=UPI00226A3898|nr:MULTISPECIES: toprim domain-containing protein [unclassified Sphingomonas]